jgi:hypothetical protein
MRYGVQAKRPGGLGIINTRLMNDCLLVKWIWKILQEPDALWFKHLKAKYMVVTNFFLLLAKGVPNFGKGYTKSNINLNEEQLLGLEMVGIVSSGKIVGSWTFH